MNTQDTIEHHCEACFGIGQLVEMRPIRFGQKIAPPPTCTVCNGTGKKPKAD
jgi:DnaJ-class molecular chaperone